MTTHQFHSLAELSTPLRRSNSLRDYAKDIIIDRLNAECTDGRVIYGNKYVRNGKRFFINDSNHSPYRDFNRRRIFDLFDALHNDPETRNMAYPKVLIDDDGGDYYCQSTTKSFAPFVHLNLRDGLLYPEAVLHEFGHHRDFTLRGLSRRPGDITAEQRANDELHHEDQAADHAIRINRFLHPACRLAEDRLVEERAFVLRAYNLIHPANSYVERIMRRPDEIGGRRRYMSLREPSGSTGWLKQLLPSQQFEPSAHRSAILRLLTTKHSLRR